MTKEEKDLFTSTISTTPITRLLYSDTEKKIQTIEDYPKKLKS